MKRKYYIPWLGFILAFYDAHEQMNKRQEKQLLIYHGLWHAVLILGFVYVALKYFV